MKCKATEIMRLLEALAKETGTTLTRDSFVEMYEVMKLKNEKLPFNSWDYLYRKLFLQAKNASKNSMISVSSTNIAAIVKFLKYSDYEQFSRDEHPERNPVLQNCLGKWLSCVRCNSGSSHVLISPVIITAKGKEIRMELNGPVRLFEGIARLNGSCLFCMLQSGNEKNLHLVFKVGLSNEPEILKGVFSGLSSGGDPIAGREILIRHSEENSLPFKNQRIKIKALIDSEDENQRLIGKYFNDRSKNILSGGKASTFGWEDLEEKDAEE
jgi:hypothetical protein